MYIYIYIYKRIYIYIYINIYKCIHLKCIHPSNHKEEFNYYENFEPRKEILLCIR